MPESNNYSVNTETVKDFEQYNEPFKDGEPMFATKSCLSLTELAIWPNRVPMHEPWARVMKQDSDDEVNEENTGYKNNVDSIDQYDNETKPEGRKPIGVTEGDEKLTRNSFWRR
jgi:hypothetical protein